MKTEVLISLSPEEFKSLVSESVSDLIQSFRDTSKPESESTLLSIKEVCKLLHISKVTLHKWKKLGKIPYHRISNKIYFKRSEILEHLVPGNRKFFKL